PAQDHPNSSPSADQMTQMRTAQPPDCIQSIFSIRCARFRFYGELTNAEKGCQGDESTFKQEKNWASRQKEIAASTPQRSRCDKHDSSRRHSPRKCLRARNW